MNACPFRAQLDEWRPRIKGLVWRRLRRRGCHVDEDDLMQAGRIGLWHAVERYDHSKGEFEAFAIKTIYGHILSEVRASDYLKPSTRRAARRGEFSAVVFVSAEEVAYELIDETTPCDMLEIQQQAATLRKHFALLPEPWQRLLILRYDEQQDWPDIGAATGQTGQAAKAMCFRAIKMLKLWMRGRYHPPARHAGRQRRTP